MRSCTGEIVSFSALPGPSGSGSSSVSPWNSTRSRASAIRTTATYSRVRCSCLAKRCPCQPSATCGPGGADAEDHAPVRELVDRRGRHRGHRRASARASGRCPSRGGSCEVCPASQPSTRGGVGAVGLGGPHRVIAEPLGLLDDLELVLRAEAEAPVADVHAELHVQVSFQREGIRCPVRKAWPTLGRAPPDLARQPARRRTAYAKSPPPQPHSTVERLRLAIDCMPVATREAMLAGVQAQRADHRRRLRRRRGRRVPDARRAPLRAGARTSSRSRSSWDRFARRERQARARRATREVRILVAPAAGQPHERRRPGARPRDRASTAGWSAAGRRSAPCAGARRIDPTRAQIVAAGETASAPCGSRRSLGDAQRRRPGG